MNVPAAIFTAILQATPVPSPLPATPVPSPSPTATAPAGRLTASAATVALQPGQSQTLTVANATGAITATLDSPVATISVNQTSRTVTLLAGARPGRATLTVSDATSAAISIPVRVAFAAGVLPATVTLRVTGNAIDTQWLSRQVTLSLFKTINLQQGLSAQNVQIAPYTLPPSLAPGGVAAMPVAIRIAGGDQFLDVSGTVNVSLQNVATDAFAPPLLFYDDDPEKITANGLLYQAQVNPGTPARLYYYHENMANARRLLVVLSPAGRDPATVQLIDASAGPNIDVMSVGHAVTRDFLLRKPRNEGIITDLAFGSPVAIDDFAAMQPLDGAAGSIGIRVLSGGPVTVSVVAAPPSANAAEIASYLAAPRLPGDGHRRTGTFDIRTFGQATLAYNVGGPDASIDYGAATPPAASTQDGHDYGEYGVMRTVTFDINNQTAQPATLYFYERPLGGVVRSSFLINGQLVEVGCARVANRYQVGQPFAANPGTSRVVVQTMTDGGSNYPLEFGVTATAPQPTTPPMSAPDGCFPKPQGAPGAPASATPAPEPTG